jgi:hypothetical protein
LDLLQLAIRSSSFEEAPGETVPFEETVISINGLGVVDLVREIEAPFAAAEGHLISPVLMPGSLRALRSFPLST